MVRVRPIVNPDARYNQREAAQLLGVTRHTVRRWELEGHIRFEIRKAGRAKFTTGRQILRCWEATYL